MAGSTIAIQKQRAGTVRPKEDNSHKLLQPISGDVVGDLEVEMEKDDDGMFYLDHLDEQVGDRSEME